MESEWFELSDLWLDAYAPKMALVSIDTVRSHLCHPRMKDVGGWDMVIEGPSYQIIPHIRETFGLYKMHPQRVASIADDLRKASQFGSINVNDISPDTARAKLIRTVSEIDIKVSHSPFHRPPEDVDCLKLEMRLGSQDRPYGRHELIHELRVFCSWIWIEKGEFQAANFFLATYRKDAERVLRKCKEEQNQLSVGYESTPIAQWMEKDRARQQRVKADRKAARNCTMCGNPLGWMQRLFWVSKHEGCEEFLD